MTDISGGKICLLRCRDKICCSTGSEPEQDRKAYAMKGKLTEPRVITDYRGEPVCILPVGFYFSDERWQTIWQCYEEKGRTLTHADLRTLFPDETSLEPRVGS